YQTLATEALICLSHFEEAYPSPDRVLPGHHLIATLLREGDMEELHQVLHRHLSLNSYELHTHPAGEQLRPGRNESQFIRYEGLQRAPLLTSFQCRSHSRIRISAVATLHFCSAHYCGAATRRASRSSRNRA